MVRHWLLLELKNGAVIQDGLEQSLIRSLGMFYADDGLLVSQEPEWI